MYLIIDEKCTSLLSTLNLQEIWMLFNFFNKGNVRDGLKSYHLDSPYLADLAFALKYFGMPTLCVVHVELRWAFHYVIRSFQDMLTGQAFYCSVKLR